MATKTPLFFLHFLQILFCFCFPKIKNYKVQIKIFRTEKELSENAEFEVRQY